MDTQIAIVVSPRHWAERLHRFAVDHGGTRVRTRVMRPEDALTEAYDVFVVDDITSFLTRRLVQQIQNSQRRVLGVYDPDDFPEGKQRLLDLGVDDVIEAGASPDEFIRSIGTLATLDAVIEEPVVEDLPEGKAVEEPYARPDAGRGRVTVVGGPSGGPGATEVTLAMAGELRGRGDTVTVVDADDLSPAVAQRLGLDLHPNIRTAVDVLHHRTGSLESSLIHPRHTAYEVLCGLPNPKDWFELRAGDVTDVVLHLATVRQHVLVNVGNQIEDLSFYGGQGRFGLGRAMLKAADVIVGVGSPSPIGVARLLEWIAEVRVASGSAPLHVVVNKAPKSPYQLRQIEEELRRTFTPASITFVPFDRKVEDAVWAGEAVGSGGFTKAIAEVAATIAPFGAKRRRFR